MQKKFRAPLYEAMVAHHHSYSSSFHVPGHKSGQGLHKDGADFLQAVMSIDYTEITGLDDLHHPDGVIKDAEELAADCFGAEETFFLVGGSTVGNLAMIAAVCDRDDVILIQRNAHKSVINGLMLAGAKAVFITPAVNNRTGIATSILLEDVEQALALYPEAKALFLTNPNYYGMGIDLKPFADFMHSKGKILLVDEAHGAHYGFHPDLPASALSQGADAVVQSTHKMLTAMTMGAMLHVQGPLINRRAVKQLLTMLQSSSPSYPIMASLDLARKKMHTEGKEWLDEGLEVVNEFGSRLQSLSIFNYEPRPFPVEPEVGYTTADPFKVAIYDATETLSGTELKDRLEREGCFVEMTDGRQVLLVFTPASSKEDMLRVYEVLNNICLDVLAQKKELCAPISNINKLPFYTRISLPTAFGLRDLTRAGGVEAQVRMVSAQEAVGKCSADMVIPYPPGIPYLYPGEMITATVAEALLQLAARGIKFQGTEFGQTQS
ncbi:aminotransferase class I/II-fold pyridoxal phosphate-dependent enzyme [Paenibacillus sp. N3.4]|nr:aminotransferase class I/II-fold pyridoxal phosphate-dependent enzyme [Paenibacillus sp. N3.4]